MYPEIGFVDPQSGDLRSAGIRAAFSWIPIRKSWQGKAGGADRIELTLKGSRITSVLNPSMEF